MQKDLEKKRRGQSLLEMLMALSMLTIAFLGIMTLVARSFFLNRIATGQTTATYLAAEGIEVTDNIVQHDIYAGNKWGTCCGTGGAFTVEYDSTSLTPLFGNTPPLLYNAASGTYQYKTGAASPYSRTIYISVAANEITVKSIVQWSSGAFNNQSVEVDDDFYNWHP